MSKNSQKKSRQNETMMVFWVNMVISLCKRSGPEGMLWVWGKMNRFGVGNGYQMALCSRRS